MDKICEICGIGDRPVPSRITIEDAEGGRLTLSVCDGCLGRILGLIQDGREAAQWLKM